MITRKLGLAVTAACLLFAAHAEAVDFSLGWGSPYLLVTEFSHLFGADRYRSYVNYKVGLQHGPSIGVERAVGSTRQAAFGVSAGAIGIRDADSVDCGPRPSVAKDSEPSNWPNVGYAICGLSAAFDVENIIGLGANLKIAPQGLHARGWNLRLEAGYGRGLRSNNGAFAGSVGVFYQF